MHAHTPHPHPEYQSTWFFPGCIGPRWPGGPPNGLGPNPGTERKETRDEKIRRLQDGGMGDQLYRPSNTYRWMRGGPCLVSAVWRQLKSIPPLFWNAPPCPPYGTKRSKHANFRMTGDKIKILPCVNLTWFRLWRKGVVWQSCLMKCKCWQVCVVQETDAWNGHKN